MLIATHTLGSDFPDIRAGKLAAAVTELKGENGKSASPLFGKLSGRYGYALAFQKVFLAGDERWRPFLPDQPSSGSMTTNIE